MTMKMIALLLLMSPAMAQTTWTVTGSQGTTCYMQGIEFPGRNGVCFAEDMKKGHPMGIITGPALATGNVYSTNALPVTTPIARCPEGRTLVTVDGTTAKCAKDLTDPE